MRNRKKRFQRVTSLAVALLMCLSMLPGTALAAEAEESEEEYLTASAFKGTKTVDEIEPGEEFWLSIEVAAVQKARELEVILKDSGLDIVAVGDNCVNIDGDSVEADDGNVTCSLTDAGEPAILYVQVRADESLSGDSVSYQINARSATGGLLAAKTAALAVKQAPAEPNPAPAPLSVTIVALAAEEAKGTETGGVYVGTQNYKPGDPIDTVLLSGLFFFHVEVTGDPGAEADVSLALSSGMRTVGSVAHSTREGDGASQEHFVLNEDGMASWDVLVKVNGTALEGTTLTGEAACGEVEAACRVVVAAEQPEQPPVAECQHPACKWESEMDEQGEVVGVYRCLNCGVVTEECEHSDHGTFAMSSLDSSQHDVYCDYCQQKIGTAGHVYGDNGMCECGAQRPDDCLVHTYGWAYDETGHWKACEACGHKEYATRDPEEHTFGDPEVTKSATCTEPGEMTRTCTVCRYAETEEIPAEHNWKEDATKIEPTCTEEGKYTLRCTVCGAYETKTITALGHDWETIQTGTNMKKVCKRCGEVADGEGESCIHKYEVTITKEATCTEPGTRDLECVSCGYEKKGEVIPATGHVYGEEWEFVGTGHYKVCESCGERTPQELHSFEKTTEAPTCTDEGLETAVCLDCGYSYTIAVEMLGHSYVDGICERCGAASNPGHEHIWYEEMFGWPATCTRSGTVVYGCSVEGCNETMSRTLLPLGHSYGEWTVTTAATATTDGERTHTCTRCSAVETEVIPATGTTPSTPTTPSRPSGGSSSGGSSNRRPGSSGSSSGGGTTTITDNPTPLAPTVDIEDEDTPLAGLPGFLDVKPGDWFYDAVVYVYGHGLMNGVSGTAFAPGDSTLRGMIVTVLHRMEDTPDADPAGFLDVLEGRYYFDAVGWGTANEIVKGYGNGLFGPEDTITREQLAAILYRYAQFKGYDTSARASLSGFADAGQVSAYAVEAMQWAVAEELINGVTDTLLSPKSHATRAQIATILMRFEENVAA